MRVQILVTRSCKVIRFHLAYVLPGAYLKHMSIICTYTYKFPQFRDQFCWPAARNLWSPTVSDVSWTVCGAQKEGIGGRRRIIIGSSKHPGERRGSVTLQRVPRAWNKGVLSSRSGSDRPLYISLTCVGCRRLPWLVLLVSVPGNRNRRRARVSRTLWTRAGVLGFPL